MTSHHTSSDVNGFEGEPDPETATVDRAIEAMERGDPILVHDAAEREGEVDLIYHADAVTPQAVSRLRNDAGGLICVAVDDAVAETFGLPFLADAVDHPAATNTALGYGDRPSFSVTVNHRDTFTGVTDEDRSTTIRALGRVASRPEDADFASEFRIPGHVQLLRGARGGLADRQGHTELALALAAAAGLSPAVVVCEMLDDETCDARTPQDAQTYADRHGLNYVEGRSVVDRLG